MPVPSTFSSRDRDTTGRFDMNRLPHEANVVCWAIYVRIRDRAVGYEQIRNSLG